MVTLWQIGDLSRWTSLFPYENSDRVQDPHDTKLDKFKKIDGTVSQQFSSGGKMSKKKVKNQKKIKVKGSGPDNKWHGCIQYSVQHIVQMSTQWFQCLSVIFKYKIQCITQ